MDGLQIIVSGVLAAAGCGALALDHGLFRRVGHRLDRSIYVGTGDRPAVALTFDDGPSPQTPALLAFLRAEGIRATFFQCGMQVERYPEIAREVHAAGHEIGNHAYSHVRLSPRLAWRPHLPSPRFLHRELAVTQGLLTGVCGSAPRLFRAPFGQRWVGLDLIGRRLGLQGVQWTVIGHDWEWPAERIADRVLRETVPGAIICLHDGREVQPVADLSEMLAALRTIVPRLRARGYRFETVSELLEPLRGAVTGP